MACRLKAPSQYLNQYWNIVNWTLRNIFQWHLNWNSNIFFKKHVVCEMVSILSRPQCVKQHLLVHHMMQSSYQTVAKYLISVGYNLDYSGELKFDSAHLNNHNYWTDSMICHPHVMHILLQHAFKCDFSGIVEIMLIRQIVIYNPSVSFRINLCVHVWQFMAISFSFSFLSWI